VTRPGDPTPLDGPAVLRALPEALRHHQAGDVRAAEAGYRRVLTAVPDQPDALHFLGILCHQTGRNDESLTLLERAASRAPTNPDVHCNVGLVMRAAGRLAEAEQALRRALVLDGNLPQGHNNLGGVLLDGGDLEGAIASYREAVRLAPDYVEALINLADALNRSGHADQAREPCELALRLAPDFDRGHAILGQIEGSLGEDAAATASFRRACALTPDNVDYVYSLGASLETERRWDEARAVFDRALALDPDHGHALSGALLLAKATADWAGLAPLSERFAAGVRRGLSGLTPFIYLAEPDATGADQLACATLWSNDHARRVQGLARRLDFRFSREPRERITVGYFSYDFRRHPTAYTKVGLFEQHDRSRFRVLGYCNGPDDDSAIRRRVVGAFDGFADVRGWTPDRVAKRIYADGVDILVDLKGHTLNAPTEVFALRPAPLQVNYKGYPGTIGGDFMDYVVVDDFVVPAPHRDDFSESTVNLPETYWVDDSRRTRPATPPTRAAAGLPEDGFVYCGFNNSYKITPPLFDRWMEILRAVDGSVLWLQNTNPGSSLADNLRREAERRGVGGERILFAPRRPLADYLALFLLADLFLDARPYNAHTTASDALWCGLPVLTCPGETFASRVAGSLLRVMGLDDLIAPDMDAYVATAVGLARNPGRLEALRIGVAAGRATSPLYDTARLTRHMEAAYERMMADYLAGRPPRHFDVPALPRAPLPDLSRPD
jgi:predicted O-linked N-acetylglucosamine transferase (SPINDLY family)